MQPPLSVILKDPVSQRFPGRRPDSPAEAERVAGPDRYGEWLLAGVMFAVGLVTIAGALILHWL